MFDFIFPEYARSARGAARGLAFTTAKSGFFGGESLGFIGVFDGSASKNSQKHLPVSKVGLK
jgi:hypothetical protein